MIKTAAGPLGLKPQEVWEMTPAELMLSMEGYSIKRQQQVNDMIYISWHVEAFARQKRLPKLAALLKEKPVKKEITAEELIETAKRKGLKGPWR